MESEYTQQRGTFYSPFCGRYQATMRAVGRQQFIQAFNNLFKHNPILFKYNLFKHNPTNEKKKKAVYLLLDRNKFS